MNKLLMFTLGAAAGSLLTWKIVEGKYKKIADEEIESVKEHYKNREQMMNKFSDDIKAEEITIETKKEYENLVQDLDYSNEEDDDEGYVVELEPAKEYIEPYVIEPMEYGDIESYTTESWAYYTDGILTNEDGEIVTDPENIIGDGLSHFGEYDEDSVYIRNDNDKCDYEIIKYYKQFDGVDS